MIMPRWVSRCAAVILLFAAAVVAYGVIVAPLVARYRENRDAIAHARKLLAQSEQVQRTRAQLRAQLDSLSESRSSQNTYLTGATEALAAADLQDRVKSIIQAGKGDLRSIQAILGSADNQFQEVKIRTQMTATTEVLYQVFYRLEYDKPYVFLDNVEIRSPQSRREGDAEDFDPILQIRFDSFGYLPVEGE